MLIFLLDHDLNFLICDHMFFSLIKMFCLIIELSKCRERSSSLDLFFPVVKFSIWPLIIGNKTKTEISVVFSYPEKDLLICLWSRRGVITGVLKVNLSKRIRLLKIVTEIVDFWAFGNISNFCYSIGNFPQLFPCSYINSHKTADDRSSKPGHMKPLSHPKSRNFRLLEIIFCLNFTTASHGGFVFLAFIFRRIASTTSIILENFWEPSKRNLLVFSIKRFD